MMPIIRPLDSQNPPKTEYQIEKEMFARETELARQNALRRGRVITWLAKGAQAALSNAASLSFFARKTP